jgi:hypothetical protein
MLFTLFQHGDELAQNQLEREMYRLVAKDRSRMIEYHIERLKHFLFKMGDRRDEQNLYFAKAEARMVKDWNDPAVSEPLAILLGGGQANIAAGQEKLRAIRKQQVQNYVDDLKNATFFRNHLNSRMQEFIA